MSNQCSKKSKLPHIRTFSFHYRQKYGKAVGKIPIDTGFPCPNREKGGCIFCRPASFTPGYLDKNDNVFDQLTHGKRTILKGRFKKYFAYYQQETCTALPETLLLAQLATLFNDEDCLGIILSTRPDYLPDSLLELLSEAIHSSGKECLIELGLQSVHERSLKWLNRNHSYEDFHDAVLRIQERTPFEVGAHLIFGIPGESREDMLHSLTTVCKLGINALKLHHLQVIRDTPLHVMYSRGEINPLTLEEYIDFLMLALPQIPASVTLHRLWATSHPKLLVAPKWHVLASELSKRLEEKMELRSIHQGQHSCIKTLPR